MTLEDGHGPTDAKLVDSYQRNRDLEALDTLVGRYVERTRCLIFGMVLNESDADDITQEAFLNVVRGLSNFDRRCKFSTWLYQVAVNTTRRFFTTRRRSDRSVDGNVDGQAGPAVDEPERKATAGELHDEIMVAIDSLSPPLRTAMILTVIDGLPAKEVADIEGCAPETIRWRVHEARKILKDRLAKYLKP